ncbi:MAG: flagellar basal-body rod protein FlgF [Gammaproteobacteria bacterium]|nr:flagellar basal-body rod protein FlgF [Gammaproteobacteria bacterium]
MDKMIYVAMNGARETMRAQTVVSHNVANVSTTGFRALQHSLQSAPVTGGTHQSRVNAVGGPEGWSHQTGAMVNTGQELDVAIQGEGWLTVQTEDGDEAYTRAGSLRVNAERMLETANGFLVMGDGGPISLPPYQSIEIGRDGQISIVPQGQNPDTIAEVDRLKLVNPPNEELIAGRDGLFRGKEGPFEADPSVRLNKGQLEDSNVNASEALVQMIQLSRHYEMQIRAMHTAEENDEAAARLMRMGG